MQNHLFENGNGYSSEKMEEKGEVLIRFSVTDNLEAIRAKFSLLYPFLKLVFFRTGGQKIRENLWNKQSELPSTAKIQTFLSPERQSDQEVIFDFSPHRTVSDLHTELQEKLEVGASCFRKSASVWVATTLTEDWTLSRQNEEGALMCNKPI